MRSHGAAAALRGLRVLRVDDEPRTFSDCDRCCPVNKVTVSNCFFAWRWWPLTRGCSRRAKTPMPNAAMGCWSSAMLGVIDATGWARGNTHGIDQSKGVRTRCLEPQFLCGRKVKVEWASHKHTSLSSLPGQGAPATLVDDRVALPVAQNVPLSCRLDQSIRPARRRRWCVVVAAVMC